MKDFTAIANISRWDNDEISQEEFKKLSINLRKALFKWAWDAKAETYFFTLKFDVPEEETA